MKALALLALALVACGLEQPGFQCPADPAIAAMQELVTNPYEPPACPMEVYYRGKGCVPCEYIDTCGASYVIGGCSPAEGVFCFNSGVNCPGHLEISPDTTVKNGELQ